MKGQPDNEVHETSRKFKFPAPRYWMLLVGVALIALYVAECSSYGWEDGIRTTTESNEAWKAGIQWFVVGAIITALCVIRIIQANNGQDADDDGSENN